MNWFELERIEGREVDKTGEKKKCHQRKPPGKTPQSISDVNPSQKKSR